jgi:hypothetical protein
MKRWHWILGAAVMLSLPVQATAQIVVSCGTSLPVVVPAGTGSTSLSFSAMDPAGPPNPDPGYNITTGPVWSWTAQVISGPAGGLIDVTGQGAAATVTLSGMSGSGHWQIVVTAIATYNTGYNQVQRFGTMGADVWAVGIDHIQFQQGASGYLNVPAGGLYIKTGTVVNFKAILSPPGAPFPPGQPVWSGQASGTGEIVSVVFPVPSVSMTDYQEVTATYGNSVTVDVIRYGPDTGSVVLDFDPADPTSFYAYVTYKLWLPDVNGQPYGSGIAELDTVPSFDDATDLSLIYKTEWPFSNGVQENHQYLIQSGVNASDNLNGTADTDAPPDGAFDWKPPTGSGYFLVLSHPNRSGFRLCQDPAKAAVAAEVKKVLAGEAVKQAIAQATAEYKGGNVKCVPDTDKHSDFLFGTEIAVALATQASSADYWFWQWWLHQPAAQTTLSASPASVTDAKGKQYDVHTAVGLWNNISELTGYDGWKAGSTRTVGKGYNGRSRRVNNVSGRAHGELYYNWSDPGRYKMFWKLGENGVTAWHYPDRKDTAQLSADAEIMWP